MLGPIARSPRSPDSNLLELYDEDSVMIEIGTNAFKGLIQSFIG